MFPIGMRGTPTARASSSTATAWVLLLAFLCFGVPAVAASSSEEERAQTVVHLLDYVSVDYPNFVRDGQVLNYPSEYAEQREFATQAVALLEQLPTVPDEAALIDEARRLQARIEGKADGPEVAALAASVRADVIRVYALTVAPREGARRAHWRAPVPNPLQRVPWTPRPRRRRRRSKLRSEAR